MERSAQIDLIAKFFFLMCFNEDLATQLTVQCLKLVKKKLRSNQESSIPSILVSCTYQTWERHRTKKAVPVLATAIDSGYALQSKVSIGAWRQFHKDASIEDFVVVLWSRILKVDEKDIATGFDLSEGTVRYRIARGLRSLGELRGHNAAIV